MLPKARLGLFTILHYNQTLPHECRGKAIFSEVNYGTL